MGASTPSLRRRPAERHCGARRWSFQSRRVVAVALVLLLTLPRPGLPGELESPSILPEGGILYFVNTTSDAVVAGACANGLPNCSLRGAIVAANSHPGADGIQIDLPAGSIINLTQALPDITESVALFGPGADQLTVRRNTGGNYRIFFVNVSGTVTISGMTIRDGNHPSSGGGLQVGSGTVNLQNVAVRDNIGGNGGGGIGNLGVLNLSGCLVTGNSAPLGGGIQNDGGFTLKNSTVSGNMAQIGGGIFFGDGSVVVTNSTISRNMALSLAGGIYTQDSQPVTKSTIIALNTAPTNPDLFGTFSSQGFNLVGISDTVGGFTQATDKTGTLAQPLDPKLDPNGLQDNGGPTQTIALLMGSPAIDKGTSAAVGGTLTTDQRGAGFPRKLDYPTMANASGGDGTDIGAFEFGGPLLPLSVSRKAHGAAMFDIDLPLTGTPGVECRVSGSHQMIMTFPGPVTLMQASVTSGTGSVADVSVIGSQITVNLAGVGNAQRITLTLFGVSNGSTMADVQIPISVLLGDTNGNGIANATDVAQTKALSGQAASASNFRSDVNASGAINATDIGQVKAQSGTQLP